MKEDMQALVLQLIIKEGLAGALIILQNLEKVTTLQDAIEAVDKSLKYDWSQFKQQRQSAG